MIKRTLKGGGAAIALGLGLIVGLAPAVPTAQETHVLRYADHNTGASPRGAAVKRWFELIEEESGGELTVEPYFGAVLGKSTEALQMVKTGSVDMALVIPDYFPKAFLANNIYKLFPIGPGNWENIKWVYDQLFDQVPAFAEEFNQQNQKPLLLATGLPVALYSAYPVVEIEDLKDKRWRASSRWHQAFFEYHGAVPTAIPWSDVYMALQTGLLDGNLADYDGSHMAKLDEVAKHVYTSKSAWWGSPFFHTINLDTWNSLSEEHQEILVRTAEQVMNEFFPDAFAAEFQRVKNAQKEMGVSVRMWSDEFLADWANPEMLAKYRGVWAEEAEAAGLADADEVSKAVAEIIKRGVARDEN